MDFDNFIDWSSRINVDAFYKEIMLIKPEIYKPILKYVGVGSKGLFTLLTITISLVAHFVKQNQGAAISGLYIATACVLGLMILLNIFLLVVFSRHHSVSKKPLFVYTLIYTLYVMMQFSEMVLRIIHNNDADEVFKIAKIIFSGLLSIFMVSFVIFDKNRNWMLVLSTIGALASFAFSLYSKIK